jgi:archaellum biogenesis protein FlaJ (TadC family)
MGKVTSVCLLLSTVVLLVAFWKGMSLLHGGDVGAHLTWAVATLVSVLGANVFAMFHAAQSDRIIRALRRELEQRDRQPPRA